MQDDRTLYDLVTQTRGPPRPLPPGPLGSGRPETATTPPPNTEAEAFASRRIALDNQFGGAPLNEPETLADYVATRNMLRSLYELGTTDPNRVIGGWRFDDGGRRAETAAEVEGQRGTLRGFADS